MQATEKKEDRRVRRTKKLLTQSLMALMEQKQIQDITVTELTKLADVNRGTFYLYYRDIFDMLEQIENSLFDSLAYLISLHEKEVGTKDAQPALLDLFTFVKENQAICRVLLSEHGDMNFLQRLYEILYDRWLSLWSEKHKISSQEDFDYHYSFVVYGCAGLIRSWVRRQCKESVQDMAAMADQMLRSSIGV